MYVIQTPCYILPFRLPASDAPRDFSLLLSEVRTVRICALKEVEQSLPL